MKRLGIILAMIAVISGVLIYINRPNLQNFHDESVGLSFSYPSSLKQMGLSEQDKTAKFIFRAENEKGAEALLGIRYEDGLAVVGQLSHQSILDSIEEGVNKRYPTQFPEFKLNSKENFELSGRQARKFVFNYRNQNTDLTQELIAIEVNADRVIYISFQSKATDFEGLKDKLLAPVLKDLRLTK